MRVARAARRSRSHLHPSVVLDWRRSIMVPVTSPYAGRSWRGELVRASRTRFWLGLRVGPGRFEEVGFSRVHGGRIGVKWIMHPRYGERVNGRELARVERAIALAARDRKPSKPKASA